jgi:sugar lactone lactonase YvrE
MLGEAAAGVKRAARLPGPAGSRLGPRERGNVTDREPGSRGHTTSSEARDATGAPRGVADAVEHCMARITLTLQAAPRRTRRARALFLLLPALALGYFFAWPVPIAPLSWDAPRAPPLTGPYAANDRLKQVEWLGRGAIPGPEATAIDARGRVVTGTRDGRILRLEPATGAVSVLASTGGRPLGLAFGPSGRLVIADARRGLLALSPAGELAVLATGHDGTPFRILNDVVVAPDGTIYFTESSTRFGMDEIREDILEHGGTGRLLAYRPATRTTEVLLRGLQFANGVALSGDASFLLVDETGAYRVTRYWLSGPRRGSSEPFLENLPGLPDNITYSRRRRLFWLALYSPRVPALDLLSSHPLLRKVVLRLPLWIQPQPEHHAFVLGVDEQGNVVENLQDASPGCFAPVTSVREHAGALYLGSLELDAVGRIPAPPLPRGRQ